VKQAPPTATTLTPDSLSYALSMAANPKGHVEASALFALIADILDSLVRGEITHVTLGLNKKLTSYLLTVNYPDGNKRYVPGEDISDLVYQVAVAVGDPRAGALLDVNQV